MCGGHIRYIHDVGGGGGGVILFMWGLYVIYLRVLHDVWGGGELYYSCRDYMSCI